MKLSSGHEVTVLEGEENARLRKHFAGYCDGLVRLSPGRWLLPGRYYDLGDEYYNFKFRKGDVLVMTYPKCGTTWMQEIVWTMRNSPNLDHPDAHWAVMDRAPFIDFDLFFPKTPPETMGDVRTPAFKRYCPDGDPRGAVSLQVAKALPDPRTLKTHLPFSLLQPDILDHTKVVYVARNPKDVVLSYLHHHRLFRSRIFTGTLEDFVEYFIQDDLVSSPYWLHLKEAWERKVRSNMHFVFYEDMKADIMGELKKLDDFLGTRLSTEQLENVAKHTSFSEMRARDRALDDNLLNQEIRAADGGFFRQGEAGTWIKKLPPELIQKMDQWIKEKCDFGIKFK